MIQKALLLSGGRTSGFMAWRELKQNPNYRDEFLTLFCNTGKERPETLDFVHEMETRWSLPVIWLEYTRVPAASIMPGIFPTKRRNQNLAELAMAGESAHWFKQVNYNTASRDGKPFDELLEWMTVLPNQGARVCSVQLKIRSAMRYLFSIGVHQYAPHIGIRIDEAHRVLQINASCDAFEHPKFPLVDASISERDVMKFWSGMDFDLKLQSYQGNCDMCFLKAKHKRVRIAKENPDLVGWWRDWEEKKAKQCDGDGRFFRKGEPLSLISQLSQQPELPFIFESDNDIPCTCVEKAFDRNVEE